MIRPLPARRNAARSTCLMLCLICAAALAGCERSQQPGPGPKPISSNGTTSTTPAPATPAATAASGAQGATR